MTDYGFWDIEVNATNDITYSYTGKKEICPLGRLFQDESKLIRPDIKLNSAETAQSNHGRKFVEYDDLWAYTEDSELTGYWKSLNHQDGIKYWDYIIDSTGKRLDFQGGT